MPANTTEFLEKMRERARLGMEWWAKTYDVGREDVNFVVANKQWDKADVDLRATEGRPALTMNKLSKHIKQVVNDVRERRPAIHCTAPAHVAAGESFKTEKQSDISQAEFYEGLIRQSEIDYGSEAHYDRAFQHAAEAGAGWLRVLTEFEDDGFDQRFKIISMRNRWAVILDYTADELDFSDANWGFVFSKMDAEEFREEYPDAIIGDLSSRGNERQVWIGEKTVTVAEYFTRKEIKRELLLLSDNRVVYLDEIEDQLPALKSAGIVELKRREVKTWKVEWRKCTAWSVLEGPTEWAGTSIPLVPIFGDAIDLDDLTVWRSLCHDAKDEQRAHNFWMTSATERVALSPKAPWVGTAEQFRGHPEWDHANERNYSKLEYNNDPSAPGPPQRQLPATMPAAELQMAMSFENGIMSTLGRYEASVGQRSNETSGKAIMARAQESDKGSFNFQDNLGRALRRVGIICVELIPKIYDSENRTANIVDKNGIPDAVIINKIDRSQESGAPVVVHDVARGKVAVEVRASKSSDSMRTEVVEALSEVARSVPSIGALVVDVIAANMDWPGATQLSERLKKSLPPQLLTQQERQDLGIPEDAPPSPEQQAEMAKSQADMKKAEADVAMAEAKKMEAVAKLKEIEMQAQMGEGGQLEETIRRVVAQALAELTQPQG